MPTPPLDAIDSDIFMSYMFSNGSDLGTWDDKYYQELDDCSSTLTPATSKPAPLINPAADSEYPPLNTMLLDSSSRSELKANVRQGVMRGKRQSQPSRALRVKEHKPSRARPANSTKAESHGNTSAKLRATPRRIKTPDSLSTASLSDGSDDDNDGLHVRASHNQIEKNYRSRLNNSFAKLLVAVKSSAPDDDSFCAEGGGDRPRSLSKGNVLNLARQRLVSVTEENEWLRNEVNQLNVTLGTRCN